MATKGSPSGASDGRLCGLPLWMCVVVLSAVLLGQASACPALCTCSGTTVDCHGLGLKTMPRNIPRTTERLELNGNNLTRVTKSDLAGLKYLRVLRLNRNQLQQLPELLFQKTPALSRL
ncbi:hypothetical protein NHX12_022763 [Muraenolepis orangiensis]|uniref:LRRNT domain-containing protein n=1 Tax=Muraenolepis orangiensis TaxID=630683 RepID=A0A9Q0EP57_9TELE|nr:hypothetical protein NHX12_022763 [Muraenolepis orangiensis]